MSPLRSIGCQSPDSQYTDGRMVYQDPNQKYMCFFFLLRAGNIITECCKSYHSKNGEKSMINGIRRRT